MHDCYHSAVGNYASRQDASASQASTAVHFLHAMLHCHGMTPNQSYAKTINLSTGFYVLLDRGTIRGNEVQRIYCYTHKNKLYNLAVGSAFLNEHIFFRHRNVLEKHRNTSKSCTFSTVMANGHKNLAFSKNE